MKTPLITTEDFGWVEVVKVSQGLGVFVDIGVSKDILIPGDEFSGFFRCLAAGGRRIVLSS
ncbi:hypothetical protein GCM10020331_079020 [Ectobacillus funiculus]